LGGIQWTEAETVQAALGERNAQQPGRLLRHEIALLSGQLLSFCRQ
jgi:hypothetical protein